MATPAMKIDRLSAARGDTSAARSGAASLLARHVVRPGSQEIEENPPLRMTGGMGKEQTGKE